MAKKDNMKIVVIGGFGFIGKILISQLSKHHKVLVITKNMPDYKIDPNIIPIQCKIQNPKIIDLIEKSVPDIIIHMASAGGLKKCQENPVNTFEVDVFGTYNILAACKKTKSKLIFLSSREVYGELTNVSLKENDELLPKNILGLAKMLAEHIIISLSKQNRIPYVIFRITNVYGPNKSKSGINQMIFDAVKKNSILVKGGKQIINLIHVNDVVNVIINSLNNSTIDNEIINVGTNDNISIKDLSLKISSFMENDIDIRIIKNESDSYTSKNFKPDISKLQRLLTSKFIKLDEGLKQTINWSRLN